MATSGRGRHCLALFTLLLLAHTAVAAHLGADVSAEQLDDFDVLVAIQTEVHTMNKNLEDLSDAIGSIPDPTEGPSTPSPSDTPPSSTDKDTSDDNDPVSIEYKPHSLFISKNFLTLEVDDEDNGDCDDFKDIEKTLENAHVALDLVSAKQLSNSTLEDLQTNNARLNSTTFCVKGGDIKPDNTTVVKEVLKQTQASGQTAADTIDNIVNPTPPPTSPPPEDDSGFKSATIALGVLFALSLVAVAGLAIYARKQRS